MNHNANTPRPSVWFWYVIYCVFMFFTYFLFCIYLYFLITSEKEWVTSPFADTIITRMEAAWSSLLGGSAALAIGYIIAPFLPRKPWVWVYGIVAICIGFSNCCLLPATIPILIFWLKPETKQFYHSG